MPKNKITAKEIKREDDLTAACDVKNLIDLENRQPEIVERIRALLEVCGIGGAGVAFGVAIKISKLI